jgi:hypothetical protein
VAVQVRVTAERVNLHDLLLIPRRVRRRDLVMHLRRLILPAAVIVLRLKITQLTQLLLTLGRHNGPFPFYDMNPRGKASSGTFNMLEGKALVGSKPKFLSGAWSSRIGSQNRSRTAYRSASRR